MAQQDVCQCQNTGGGTGPAAMLSGLNRTEVRKKAFALPSVVGPLWSALLEQKRAVGIMACKTAMSGSGKPSLTDLLPCGQLRKPNKAWVALHTEMVCVIGYALSHPRCATCPVSIMHVFTYICTSMQDEFDAICVGSLRGRPRPVWLFFASWCDTQYSWCFARDDG